MDTVWVHKDCGMEIESELRYSDSDNDYYFPVCPVHGDVSPTKDAELVDRVTRRPVPRPRTSRP